jgi:hypothetical protein
VIPDDAEVSDGDDGDETDADGDDEGGSSDDEVEVDDILNEMEREGIDDGEEGGTTTTDFSSARVADLRRALRDANVTVPSGAKKAELVRLAQEHKVTIQAEAEGNSDDIAV